MIRPSQRSLAPLLVALAAALALAAPLLRADERGGVEVIRATMPAVVMVIAVDVRDGRLVPVGAGSGTIVDPSGAVLTNHHLLHDAAGDRLHDLFVIGRFRAADREPEMVCAGSPSRGRLKPEVDLALLRCDLDMNGQSWLPEGWPTLPMRRLEQDDVVPGEQVWVLGYPNVGGGTIHVTAGLVSGWTGEHGGAGSRAFMKTDAAITHGNSGGTAIDEDGNFIGVPTAFRVTTSQHGQAIVTAGKVGLIRPLEHARDLIAAARKGFVPGAAEAVADAEPAAAIPAPARAGVTVRSRVVDAANGRPVEGAFVIVFRAGIGAGELDTASLDDQALTSGQTDGDGVFRTTGPVPRGGRYTVAVIAPGYRPLAEDGALTVGDGAPDLFDPWGALRIERE